MTPARKKNNNVVAVIPASGSATRMGRLPYSKEVLPVAFQPDREVENNRVRVACDYLLDNLSVAGIRTGYMLIRDRKWDIPGWLGGHPRPDMQLAFIVTGETAGVPHTLDEAYSFIRDDTVALGFPDIIIEDKQCLERLLRHHRANPADLSLGLFPADQPRHSDLVDVNGRGEVRNVIVKPARSSLRFTWGLAVWTPAFTEFLHEELCRPRPAEPAAATERHVGHIIQAAVADGMRVTAIEVSSRPYIDIGRPESYLEAIRRLGGMEH